MTVRARILYRNGTLPYDLTVTLEHRPVAGDILFPFGMDSNPWIVRYVCHEPEGLVCLCEHVTRERPAREMLHAHGYRHQDPVTP